MTGVRRGRLLDAAEGPRVGERLVELAAAGPLLVEQILSGDLEAPVDYEQATDEWVVLLAGAAVLEVGGEALELGPGDWLFLPAGTPHRLVRTEAGSSWLAVHRRP